MTQLAFGLFRVQGTVVAEKERAGISTRLLCCLVFNGQRRLVATGGAPPGTTSDERYYRRDQTLPMHRKNGLEGNAISRPHDIRMVLALRHVPRSTVALHILVQPISIFRQVCSIELNQCEFTPRKSPNWPSMMYAPLEMRLARR